MHVLGLPNAPTSLEERIGRAMQERGPLGVVSANGETTDIECDGAWMVTAEGAAIDDVLDMLAPRCAFVLVCGTEVERCVNLTVTNGTIRSDLLDDPQDVDAFSSDELVERLARTEPYVTLESLVEEVKNTAEENRAGAIATFTGRVRAKEDPDDVSTEYLEFEQYGDIAHDEMTRIREDLMARDDVYDVRLHHRSGVLHAGQDIVFVVVLAGHREQAFQTVADGINRLKAEVPIFKKEVTVDEEFWVHNRP